MESNTKQNKQRHIKVKNELNARFDIISKGGGQEKIAKHKAKGKLTARERIDYLLDNPKQFVEIGRYAAENMYEEYGGCPCGGVITGIGKIKKQHCIIVANDATVKAGAWFPISGKKNLRAQEIALENKLPIIYLVDSAGVFLPLQKEVFPDKYDFGRTFRNNAIMSSKGIVQIAAIMGSCVAGGAYLPMMSDESLIVEKTGTIFLAGSYLVKSAIGETIDNEKLGGATTHTELSGVVDNKFKTDKDCLDYIKNIIAGLNFKMKNNFKRFKTKKPKYKPEKIYDLLPFERTVPYNMLHILECIIDKDSLSLYKEDYGKTLICGTANIRGWQVGIVANQRMVVKNAKKEMQMGGVIYGDAASKAARFIMNCNQRKIPLVFFQDVSGFMIGSKAEHRGIMKEGAKMVAAMANSTVPKFTFIVGNSYGAGNYAMCGKAYDPKLIFGWPTAKIGVMSGEAAGNTLLQINLASAKKRGDAIDERKHKQLKKAIIEDYNESLSPIYAAARLWIDDIVSPLKTRQLIHLGLTLANRKKTKKFNVGIIQT